MRKYCLLFVLLSLLTISCKKDPSIKTTVKEVDFLNNTQDKVLEGILVDSILGSSNIVIFDTLMMVQTSDPEGQIKVYSTRTLNLLGSFCKKGRARNEMNRLIVSTEQAYYKDGHVILVAVDVPNIFKEIDITASLNSGSTVVISTQECMSLNDGEFMILGNDYNTRYEFYRNVYENQTRNGENKRVPSRYYLYKEGKRKELKFFSSVMKSEVRTSFLYIGNLYKHPSKNIVVQSFERLDYLLFMDFDSTKKFAVHNNGSLTFNDVFVRPTISRPDDLLHFTDGASSSDYLMFLYWQGDYTRKQNKDRSNPEILVFDWDGNYITGFKLGNYVRSIEYDELHKKLYGLDADERLFAFDLNNILP